MYQQNPYSYGYGAYQQTYYPIANQGWNGNQQVSQQIPQRPMTFSQQSNLYEKVNGFEEVRSYHMYCPVVPIFFATSLCVHPRCRMALLILSIISCEFLNLLYM